MISIIVPIYNSECYLQECIASVQQQVYQDFELLLIDDGSTDSGPELCRRFQKADPRIRFYSQKHQGVSRARNTALDMSQGNYVFFLDSDDVIDPWILERFMGQIRLQKAEMAFCPYSQGRFLESGRMEGDAEKEGEWILLDPSGVTELFSINHRIFGGIGGKLIAKDTIGQLRFETGLSLGEDTLFLYRLIQKGIRAVYTTKAMYYYRPCGGTSVLQYSMKGITDACKVSKEIESGEQKCGRTDNAGIWEGEYLRYLRRAMGHLKKNELYQMRKDVAEEFKNPYFRQRKFKARIAVFLAFYCYPLYRAAKAVYHFLADTGDGGIIFRR